jgi:SAM-dependent methyltransferase
MNKINSFKTMVLRSLVFKFSKLDRWGISAASLSGSGLEIGAMDLPLHVKSGVAVKYLDRISKEDSAKIFPNLSAKLVNVDIIGDGETLDVIETNSQDFVIGNHFIEHTQNPILTIENMLRVTRTGGKVFMAIPDKRFTFDEPRSITPLAHFIKDYTDGPAWSEHDHYVDFVKHTEHGIGKSELEIEEVIKKLKQINWSIHYHVWDHQSMIEMFSMIKSHFGFKFEIELAIAPLPNGNESIFVLKKC